jgi:hypothetical protein
MKEEEEDKLEDIRGLADKILSTKGLVNSIKEDSGNLPLEAMETFMNLTDKEREGLINNPQFQRQLVVAQIDLTIAQLTNLKNTLSKVFEKEKSF